VLGGIVTVIWISLSTVKQGADGHGFRSMEPTFTSVAPVKFVPPRTTLLPPAVEPDDGTTLVNVGAGVTKKYDRVPDVPLGFPTSTETLPAAWAGTL
jgi:hypothetical protein